MLGELCGLGGEAAVEVASSLQRYAALKLAKLQTHVVRSLSLRDLVSCFELPGKMGRSVELCRSGEGGVVSSGEGGVASSGEGGMASSGKVGVVSGEGGEMGRRVTVNIKKGIGESSLSDLSELLSATVEPLNNGHIGDEHFPHCSEVVPISEVK